MRTGHSGSADATLKGIAELHGFNATALSFGRPDFGIPEWISFVSATAGGFVGRVEAGHGMPGGLLAYVPSGSEAGGFTPVSDEFLEGLSLLHPCDTIPAPSRAARHFAEMASLLLGLCAMQPPAEASYHAGGISLDLARGRHAVAPGGRVAVIQDGMQVAFAADATPARFRGAMLERGSVPATSGAVATARPAREGLAGMLEKRIRKMNETGCGFVLSVADTGDPLLVLSDGGAAGNASLSITPSEAWVSRPGQKPLLLSHEGTERLARTAGIRNEVAVLYMRPKGAALLQAEVFRN